MKKHLISVLLLLLVLPTLSVAQNNNQLDTIYYDSNWKGTSHSAFASFYRIILIRPEGNTDPLPYRDFYITGQLQGEGTYLTVDKYDDGNSVFDGKQTSYTKDGKVVSELVFKNGKQEGVSTYYDVDENTHRVDITYADDKMNGLTRYYGKNDELLAELSYVDDVLDGSAVYLDYEKGTYTTTDYSKGEYSTYVVHSMDGYELRFSKDNLPKYENVSINDAQAIEVDGTTYLAYRVNGILIAISTSLCRVFGEKYLRADVVLINGVSPSCSINPSDIICRQADGRHENYEVYTASQFDRDMSMSQNKVRFWNSLANGIASTSAGHTTESTNYYSNGIYLGNVTTSSYNSTLAYLQKQAIAENNARFEAQLTLDRDAQNIGYLMPASLNQGEMVSGYFMIEDTEKKVVDITIPISGINYVFRWNTGK